MRILFDQGTPVAIRRSLTRQEGWATLTNGYLLRVAEDAGFELSIVVLSRNRWRTVQRMIPVIVEAVEAATPGSYTRIEIPVK